VDVAPPDTAAPPELSVAVVVDTFPPVLSGVVVVDVAPPSAVLVLGVPPVEDDVVGGSLELQAATLMPAAKIVHTMVGKRKVLFI
jgi:hypothetical protein